MINGKPRVQKKAQTTTKDKFSSLLKTLYTYKYSSDQEESSNLVAGCKKCVTNPLNVSIVLNRLPDADKIIEIVKTSVTQAVLSGKKDIFRRITDVFFMTYYVFL